MDLNVSSLPKKLKQDDQVVPCDAMDVDGVIGGGGNSKLGVNKDASPSDVLGGSVVGSLDGAEDHSGSLNSDNNDNNVKNNNNDSMNSDNDDGDVANDDEMGYEDDDYYGDDGCDYCGNDDYLYEDNDDDDDDDDDGDDYLKMQSQFDNLPAGVEVSVSLPWLNNSAPAGNSSSGASSSSAVPNHSGSETKATLSASAVINKEPCPGPSETKSQGTSSGGGAEEIIRKWKDFKQFDTVEDFSDHHFKGLGFNEAVPPKNWAKRIQEEWKILEKDLPDTISVRVYESRMELLRAVIGGPAGTPYHDGLFVFDCLFPASYPNQPPTVYYYSGGLRLNPNLYECGKVCLSLLGTWSGNSKEMWIPGESTMLQVLVSIQALILNERPFFNEPGHPESYTGERGRQQSHLYSENAFLLSLKTMMYTLRRPPKYFEDLVLGHFHRRGRDVLAACKAYVDGATVATVRIKDGVAQVNKDDMHATNGFKTSVKQMINALVTNFTRYASIECEDFRIEG